MRWLRDAWDYATYRDPAGGYKGCPNFRGRPMAAEFGPTVASRYRTEVRALGLAAARWSPREFLAVLAERDRLECGSDQHAGHAAATAAG
jgi:hypothetical protein